MSEVYLEPSNKYINSDELEFEKAEENQREESYPESSPIRFSSTNFDVEGLVNRVSRKDIIFPNFNKDSSDLDTDGFQRKFVWKKSQQVKFIESLLLGYPIPGIFLVRQKDKKLLVLDGQQRLITLQRFYGKSDDGIPGFELNDVNRQYEGKSYETLSSNERRTLDDSFIQATIVEIEHSPSGQEAIYQIFERLNSGGTQLTPHEIRVALYTGELMSVISRANERESWRNLYGKATRFRDHELILRIISVYMNGENYSRPLKKFLNDFSKQYRDASDPDLHETIRLFETAADLIDSEDGAGKSALRKHGNQLNITQTEAIFIGLMKRIASGTNMNSITPINIKKTITQLKSNDKFDAATKGPTADEGPLRERTSISIEYFSRM